MNEKLHKTKKGIVMSSYGEGQKRYQKCPKMYQLPNIKRRKPD